MPAQQSPAFFMSKPKSLGFVHRLKIRITNFVFTFRLDSAILKIEYFSGGHLFLMHTPNLQELLICRDILDDKTIKIFLEAIANPQQTAGQHKLAAALIEQAEDLGLSGNLLRSYFIYLLAQGQNTAAQMTETSNGKIGESLHQAFFHDMELFYDMFHILPSTLFHTNMLDDYTPTQKTNLPAFNILNEEINQTDNPTALTNTFLNYYQAYGYGDIANYRAFHWDKEKKLIGIRHFEAIKLTDLVGYQHQKDMLIQNTEAFATGKPANNVLLVGARGTGKSSSVKALANTYYEKGLRLIQISKSQLIELPKIMETLRQLASKKFILFLDDLSFEPFEIEYKYLKSAIEGGVESRPDNVLIYATSNRRHIIKENWQDRDDTQDELYRADSVNETISLSDRFGLTIHFLSPNQDEYLAIIDHLLQKEKIVLDKEDLRIQALRWEMTHSGRSGRVAQQFVTSYLGNL